MICIVTGAAGFIGSHLCEKLLDIGHSVIGIDSFTDFYPKYIKEQNIRPLLKKDKFEFIAKDIHEYDLSKLMKKAGCVFHLAAQAGVRTSWGQNFSIYTKNNIEATQKLLEVAKDVKLEKFIYASSSSVYGFCPELPMVETSPCFPYSPYGVTKLAAENLCNLYFRNYGVPCVSLRFFTVYGPGQRPDMAFHKFFKAIIDNKPISIYGDGKQTRDFTYIDDIIEANVASLTRGKPGEIYNLGGGNIKKLEDIFPILEKVTQQKIKFTWEDRQLGDVPHTFANIEKARKELNFQPKTKVDDGLKEEWKWIQKLYSF
ncbi:MAG: GDP-mannose 4,6-dehydratase [Acidobacteriota bacterium]|nr:GDP-mannose 4,6-dehydratase [Acidobacteriota bacterium]